MAFDEATDTRREDEHMNEDHRRLIDFLYDEYPDSGGVFTRKQIEEHAPKYMNTAETRRLYRISERVSRGKYSFPDRPMHERSSDEMFAGLPVIDWSVCVRPYVPDRMETYVMTPNGRQVEAVIASGKFFPVMITGLSGNGKTIMVEQACAALNREYVRIQITPETDEDDLIGGFRLINGSTVYFDGPVVHAMQAGAILLIDEMDRGSTKLMALQGVLEGKPVMLKKTGKIIRPMPGFNVLATANTKGQGCMTGRYTSATVVDEALLERFNVMINHDYPDIPTEREILQNHLVELWGSDDVPMHALTMIDRMVEWAHRIRKSYDELDSEDTISTRRLCHIVSTFVVFLDRERLNDTERDAVRMGTNRFDDEVQNAFLESYSKMADIDFSETEPDIETDVGDEEDDDMTA